MINNEFHLIGTCISNYEILGSKSFKTYTFKIEVEKYNGGVFELEALVYSTNKVIDVDEPIIGKQVAINGFIDSFKEKTGALKTKLVCQNMLFLTKKSNFNPEPKVVEPSAEEAESVVSADDDDLPF